MLDHVFNCVSLNPLRVYVLCPHGGHQSLHVCHYYEFSHQIGKKAQNETDCVYLTQDKKDNCQIDVHHHGKTSFSLSHTRYLLMQQALGTDPLQMCS
jgi:hypothetical protein